MVLPWQDSVLDRPGAKTLVVGPRLQLLAVLSLGESRKGERGSSHALGAMRAGKQPAVLLHLPDGQLRVCFGCFWLHLITAPSTGGRTDTRLGGRGVACTFLLTMQPRVFCGRAVNSFTAVLPVE